MNTCQNLGKLPEEALRLIASVFSSDGMSTGIEVRMDDPSRHILFGGDGYRWHGLTWSGCYLHHLGDPEWAIVPLCCEEWQSLHVQPYTDEEVLAIGDRYR